MLPQPSAPQSALWGPTLISGAATGATVGIAHWIAEWGFHWTHSFEWTFQGEHSRFIPALTAYSLILYLLGGSVLGITVSFLSARLHATRVFARKRITWGAVAIPLFALSPSFVTLLFLLNEKMLPYRYSLPSLLGNLAYLGASLGIFLFLVWLVNGTTGSDRQATRLAGGLLTICWGLAASIGTAGFVHWISTQPRLSKPTERHREERANVVLFILETTRADHLGCYGYEKDTTPNIDALAQQGALFENYYVVAPISGISRASLNTGLYPHHHGVRTHPQRIRDSVQALAEVFREAGYETADFATSSLAGPRFNYHKGFRTYESLGTPYDHFRFSTVLRGLELTLNRLTPWYSTSKKREELVNASNGVGRALDWIDRLEGSRFYIQYDLNEPHAPYEPPDPFRSRFTEPHPTYKLMDEWRGVGDIQFDFASTGYNQRDVEHTIDLYDAEIAYADWAIGEFRKGLVDRGLSENTIIVVTADHGESLGEHSLYFVHHLLFEQSIHVPLVIWHPRRVQPQRLQAVASGVDLFPTLAELAGVDYNGGRIDGTSLVARMDNDENERPVFAESNIIMQQSMTRFPNYRMYLPGVAGKWRMARLGDWKLILIPHPEGVRQELYNVREDPAERFNRVLGEPQKAEELRQLLEDWMSFDTGGDGDLDPTLIDGMREQLRALGYVN